jgi:hypothetical protein
MGALYIAGQSCTSQRIELRLPPCASMDCELGWPRPEVALFQTKILRLLSSRILS